MTGDVGVGTKVDYVRSGSLGKPDGFGAAGKFCANLLRRVATEGVLGGEEGERRGVESENTIEAKTAP